jgi:hypothetical protein
MFTETIGNSHAGRKVISRRYLLSLFIALLFALTMYPSKAQAQIVGDLEVNIPVWPLAQPLPASNGLV